MERLIHWSVGNVTQSSTIALMKELNRRVKRTKNIVPQPLLVKILKIMLSSVTQNSKILSTSLLKKYYVRSSMWKITFTGKDYHPWTCDFRIISSRWNIYFRKTQWKSVTKSSIKLKLNQTHARQLAQAPWKNIFVHATLIYVTVARKEKCSGWFCIVAFQLGF